MRQQFRSFLAGACAGIFLVAAHSHAQSTAVISTDSVSPQNGSGSSHVFTFVFSDSNGYSELLNGTRHILINTSPSGTNSCWVQIQRYEFDLAPDNPNVPWPHAAYGEARSIQNSQCIINGETTTVYESDNSVTLNLSVTFRAAYAGMKTIYTDVNSSSQYASVANYTITTSPDFTLNVSPFVQDVKAGQSTTFTVTATPLNGFNQNVALSLSSLPAGFSGTFNPSVIVGGSGSSTLTLNTSASTPTSEPSFVIVAASPSVTQTVPARLEVTAVPPPSIISTDSVSPQNGRGSTHVFTFVFSDSNGYSELLNGTRHILINTSPSGTNSCWVQIQRYEVDLAPDNPNVPWPHVAYGEPRSLQNSQCIINGETTTVYDSDNNVTLNLSVTFLPAYAGMKTIYTDVNSSSQYASVANYTITTSPDFTLNVSPFVQDVKAGQSTTFTVTATPLNGFNQNVALSLSSLPAGFSGTFNPSVIVGGSGSSTLTLNTSASTPTSEPSFVIVAASPSVTQTVPARLVVHAVPPPPTITTDSVSPQNGSGSSQVFTFTFSDTNGYGDLLSGHFHVLINSVPGGTSGCWVQLRPTEVFLAPDDPTKGWFDLPYGASRTVQNSQCTISGVGTTVSGSGNTLTLNLALTFTGAFAGTKNVYTDVNASAPYYSAVTSYTVQ